jgi:hypothetical protein
MALVLASLKSSLESQWLVPDGGSFPASPTESGDRFATAVATWFSAAMAGAFPCTTAMARKAQLASLAGAAFGAQAAPASGNALAAAVALYIVGQSFGTGIANMPLAQSGVGALFAATFADMNGDRSTKAQQIANGCLLLAVTTIVVFPPAPPLPPLPVS